MRFRVPAYGELAMPVLIISSRKGERMGILRDMEENRFDILILFIIVWLGFWHPVFSFPGL